MDPIFCEDGRTCVASTPQRTGGKMGRLEGLFRVWRVRISDLRGRAFLPGERTRVCHGRRCLSQVEGTSLG